MVLIATVVCILIVSCAHTHTHTSNRTKIWSIFASNNTSISSFSFREFRLTNPYEIRNYTRFMYGTVWISPKESSILFLAIRPKMVGGCAENIVRFQLCLWLCVRVHVMQSSYSSFVNVKWIIAAFFRDE